MAVGPGVSECGNPNIPAPASCAITTAPRHRTLLRVKTHPCKPPAPRPGVPGRGEKKGGASLAGLGRLGPDELIDALPRGRVRHEVNLAGLVLAERHDRDV